MIIWVSYEEALKLYQLALESDYEKLWGRPFLNVATAIEITWL